MTNSQNGRYLLDCTPNLAAKQNSFNFMSGVGTCFDYKVKKDWDTFGANAFTFDVLEELEQKAEQSNDEFINDLKTLAELWREKLDASSSY